MLKHVLIKPLWPNGLNNKLFEVAYPGPLQKWRREAAKNGIALDTWDAMPLEQADCIWFLDLPDTRKEYEVARAQAKKDTPFVLQIMESPLARSHNFHPKNQRLFDYLVTYQQDLPAQGNIFNYRLPNCFNRFHGHFKPFEDRKCAVMVNRNRMEGWLACRQSGLIGLPGIGQHFTGWHMPFWSFFLPARGDLYHWRRKFARLAERYAPEVLEIHGKGWNGDSISWNPLVNKRKYLNRVSFGDCDKLELISNYRFTIAVENFHGKMDYISEKIFEPMMSGSVPVYLGDENILKIIPKETFIDARKFNTQRELLFYLKNITKKDWEKMFNNGQEFIKSKKINEFTTEYFSKKMIIILNKIFKYNKISLECNESSSAPSFQNHWF
jgi:hypothetical protein